MSRCNNFGANYRKQYRQRDMCASTFSKLARLTRRPEDSQGKSCLPQIIQWGIATQCKTIGGLASLPYPAQRRQPLQPFTARSPSFPKNLPLEWSLPPLNALGCSFDFHHTAAPAAES